ncbi:MULTISPECIES: enoyl-CoA hydratase-related protein [unclassified Nocardioides]|uniref:enoyl-CoA hydratase/isomerase family protein n=1 Tax=unclassified Nocardioides TaxID=2615069 RepID=UPI000056FA4F|nr:MULTISPECIES: enoyl-CoA hydratase-related protein [unclassified Nocardioides]ABL80327.1 Enoyl-CoA hydratase [Nocardioides sp. JS614]
MVLVEDPAPGVRTITLNRPERLNALSYELFQELEEALLASDRDPRVRVVVVTGAGRAFCAGLDLGDGFDAPEQAVAGRTVGGMDAQERIARVLTTPQRMRTPVIAAINGPAAGGGLALALACDVRVASATASCNVAFVKVGLSGCDCGVSYLLPRAVGSSVAFELMLTGRSVDSEEALRIGLVSRITAEEQLIPAALETAALIVNNSPFGVQMTKRVMWQALDAPSLDAAIELENRTQILCTLTEDQPEAVAAFREKRPPRFGRR